MPAVADARTEEHADYCTKCTGSQFRSVHDRLLAVRLKAMPGKRFEPQDDECCCGYRGGEHNAKRRERLIPTRREPGQLPFDEFEFLHELRVSFSRFIYLTKGEVIRV